MKSGVLSRSRAGVPPRRLSELRCCGLRTPRSLCIGCQITIAPHSANLGVFSTTVLKQMHFCPVQASDRLFPWRDFAQGSDTPAWRIHRLAENNDRRRDATEAVAEEAREICRANWMNANQGLVSKHSHRREQKA